MRFSFCRAGHKWLVRKESSEQFRQGASETMLENLFYINQFDLQTVTSIGWSGKKTGYLTPLNKRSILQKHLATYSSNLDVLLTQFQQEAR